MEITYDMLLKKAATYCSRQEVCACDMKNKLDSWGATAVQAQKLISYLEKEKYIDDNRYCRSFVNDKFRFNKWGKLKISRALQLKQIPSSLISSALDDIDVSLYEKMLQELLTKKNREVKARNDYERHAKLMNFALGRGFEFSVAESAIKKLQP
jgi:regulatory protein